uniref:Uncharacterized protein n=1 Tax=Sphaerodactylus townsendi TaxID=933632 RepID=A0ACB8GE88_9SAUR
MKEDNVCVTFLILRYVLTLKHLEAQEELSQGTILYIDFMSKRIAFDLTFYYGAADQWCPVQYYEEMKMEFPDGDIRLCEKGIRHAFVLEASEEVAAMITEWLQDDLVKL